MITDAYVYLSTNDKTQYAFESEGIQGKIIKIVKFSQLNNGYWNLGFGDWEDGNINDKVISNNQDAIKVIKTVAKVTIEFFKEYPKSIVVIDPVDEKRKKLYNIAFQRHYKEIEPIFNVIGFFENKKVKFSLGKDYDGFEISLKFDV
jgi:hypothetical protein